MAGFPELGDEGIRDLRIQKEKRKAGKGFDAEDRMWCLLQKK